MYPASTALLVDGDAGRAERVRDELERLGFRVEVRADLLGAEAALDAATPDLLLLASSLPDGSAAELVEVLHRAPPIPPTVVLGAPESLEAAFRLGRLGVGAVVAEPLADGALARAVERVAREPADPSPALRCCVGAVPLVELERRVRGLMVDEALRRANGNRHAAARLLSVSRQMLQQWLRRSGAAGGSGSAAGSP